MILPRYVPIIRVLEGEILGAQNLSPHAWRQTCPLFRIVQSREETALANYLGKAVDRIAEAWRLRGIAYVELVDIPPMEGYWFDSHPVALVHESLRGKGVNAIPVLTTHAEREIRGALVEVSRNTHGGLCIHLDQYDLETPRETAECIRQVAREANISTVEIDVLVDLERILPGHIVQLTALVTQFITEFTSLILTRSIVVIGSSIPPDFSDVPHNGILEVPRLEMTFHREVQDALNGSIVLRYGDYVTTRPDYVDTTGPFPNMNAKLAYTLEDSTLLVRGKPCTEEKLKHQYSRLAKQLLTSGRFHGQAASWGDRLLADYAQNPAFAPGTPSTYIAICSCHHIQLVAAQFAYKLTLTA